MMTTTLETVPISAFKDNYIWTIVDHEKRTALIVDPGEAIPVKHFLETHQLTPALIIITHHHFDHMNGIHDLKKIYDMPVFGPKREKIAGANFFVQESESVHVEGFPLSFHVLDIPGHTLGHIAYYQKGILFCGDTLFAAGCGRLFEGTAEQMYQSLQKLAALPADTKVYCGHEYTANNLRFAQQVEPENQAIKEKIERVENLRKKNLPSLPSTIDEEKNTNPFLRCEIPAVRLQAEKHAGRKLDNVVDVFATLRKWKDDF